MEELTYLLTGNRRGSRVPAYACITCTIVFFLALILFAASWGVVQPTGTTTAQTEASGLSSSLVAQNAHNCCFHTTMVCASVNVEYGLVFNKYTGYVDLENVYDGGRHLIGPGKRLCCSMNDRMFD